MVGILGGMFAEVPMMSVLAKQVRLQGCLDGSRQNQINLIGLPVKNKASDLLSTGILRVPITAMNERH